MARGRRVWYVCGIGCGGESSFAHSLSTYRLRSSAPPICFPLHDDHARLCDALLAVAAIRGTERISHTRFEDGVCYMEFTDAVRRSLQQGLAVTLPLCAV